MELTKEEKEIIKYLVEKEIKEFKTQENTIRPNLPFLAVEKKYEELLDSVNKKLR